MPPTSREIVVGRDGQDAGDTQGCGRLDHVLGKALGLSLRGTRRFFEEHEILVNGHKAKPGQTVSPGDVVRVEGMDESVGEAHSDIAPKDFGGADAAPCRVRLLRRDDDFAFFEKPALMHTQTLAGRENASVEKELPRLLPGQAHARLLQRLDFETSGLLACALHEESVAQFRAHEAEGSVEKRYLAVLAGRLEEPVVVKNHLEGRGKRVAALDFDDPDTARHTSFTPMLFLEKEASLALFGKVIEATLAGCVIHRGARHQIRAHASAITHPLIYDALYGHLAEGSSLEDANRERHFLLHHARLSFAQYALESLPPWLSGIPGAGSEARKWFAQKTLVT